MNGKPQEDGQNERPAILIVDSDEQWYKNLAMLFRGEFEVVLTGSLKEALSVLGTHAGQFDAVLTEICLNEAEPQNEDGFHLIEAVIRQADRTQMFVLSRKTDVRLVKKLRQLGIDVEHVFDKNDPELSLGKFYMEVCQAIAHRSARPLSPVPQRANRRSVFTVMSFAKRYASFYENVLKKAVEAQGYQCLRVDHDLPGRIMPIKFILAGIRDSWTVLTDLSGSRPNVYLEVGIADARFKPMITLTNGARHVQGYLENYQFHPYQRSKKGYAQLQVYLENEFKKYEQLLNCKPSLYQYNFTAVEAPVEPELCLALLPANRPDCQETYLDLILPAAKGARMSCIQVSEIIDSRNELDAIWQSLNRSQLVIADLSGQDLDIFYLTGLAIGLEKDIVFLAKNKKEIPFDLRAASSILFDKSTKETRDRARADIEEKIMALLKRDAGRQLAQPARPAEKPPGGGKPVISRQPGKTPVSTDATPAPIKPGKRRNIPKIKAPLADIAILTILPDEYQAVCELIHHLEFTRLPAGQSNPYAWKVGEVACQQYGRPYRVAVGMTVRAGTIESTQATTHTAHVFQPRYIFLTGIAGGLGQIHKGDVVIADIIRGYEYGKVVQGKYQPRDNWTYQTNGGLLAAAVAYALRNDWRELIRGVPPVTCEPIATSGEIASGDKVIDDPGYSFFKAVLKRWPKTLAVEMEGVGACSAIQHVGDLGLNIAFLMIRGISDLPRPFQRGEVQGTEERDNWKPYAAHTAAAFTIGLIQEGLPLPPTVD